MLSHEQARRIYNRLGRLQETQQFYEREAVRLLIARADFAHARRVLEFGCGTGQLAEELLERHLPAGSELLALDVSSTMVERARCRLERFGPRAQVRQTDGAMRIEEPDASFDRFISLYVLDLLTSDDISALLSEARRVLTPEGLLAVAGLTHGFTLLSRFVTSAWRAVHRLNPVLVGGCRPLSMVEHLPDDEWELLHQQRCASYGVPSEVVICRPRK